jgi:hypothetical protein
MKDMLETGEYLLGRYKVQYMGWMNGEWQGEGYWQRALVTNRRLLVYPETAQHFGFTDAVMPGEIVKAWNLSMGRRDGILLLLKDKRRLYLLVDWSQGHKLVRDINDLLRPPVRPRIVPRLRTM